MEVPAEVPLVPEEKKRGNTMRKTETRGAYLQRRSAQIRRKRWEGTMTKEEEAELVSVQHEILFRTMVKRSFKNQFKIA